MEVKEIKWVGSFSDINLCPLSISSSYPCVKFNYVSSMNSCVPWNIVKLRLSSQLLWSVVNSNNLRDVSDWGKSHIFYFLIFRSWRRGGGTNKTQTADVTRYTCEFSSKKVGFSCPAMHRLKIFFNGRVTVEKCNECDHSLTPGARKYRYYSDKTTKIVQDQVINQTPAKVIRTALKSSLAVGSEVDTLQGRHAVYQKAAR